MRRIEVDEQVYAELERHVKGFEQPNDVLRRLLAVGNGQSAESRKMIITADRGRLRPMIDADLVREGDELIHQQARKGLTFFGKVGQGGSVITDRGTYSAPSPALAELLGSQINGWSNWIHRPTGKTLAQLRADLARPSRDSRSD